MAHPGQILMAELDVIVYHKKELEAARLEMAGLKDMAQALISIKEDIIIKEKAYEAEPDICVDTEALLEQLHQSEEDLRHQIHEKRRHALRKRYASMVWLIENEPMSMANRMTPGTMPWMIHSQLQHVKAEQ